MNGGRQRGSYIRTTPMRPPQPAASQKQQWRAPCWPFVVLALLLAAAPRPAAAFPWPAAVFERPPPLARTSERCRAAAGGHVFEGDALFAPLAAALGLDGPVLQPPHKSTDVTTLDTLVQVRERPFHWKLYCMCSGV